MSADDDVHSATFTKGRVRKGQNVLITGIGGGVAIQALQFCVAEGANVWVTSGDRAKIDKAVSLGAKGGVVYKENDWAKQLAGQLPKERPVLDVIIDSAMGDLVQQTMRLIKPGGIIVCYGSCAISLLSRKIVDVARAQHDTDLARLCDAVGPQQRRAKGLYDGLAQGIQGSRRLCRSTPNRAHRSHRPPRPRQDRRRLLHHGQRLSNRKDMRTGRNWRSGK